MINRIYTQNILFSRKKITSSFIVNATYTLDDSIISNPERGLYRLYDTFSGTYTGVTGSYTFLSSSSLTSGRTGQYKISTIQRQFYLMDFTSSPISTEYLTKIQTDFDSIRTAGVKALVRFSYSNFSTYTGYPFQPSKSLLLSHIDQLETVIQNNKDVIVSIQAGFIGGYGEWYYTEPTGPSASSEWGSGDYTQYTTTQWDNRREVTDRMLLRFSPLPIQVRYVYVKQTLYPSGNSRVAFFNDAFLNQWGDSGTFLVSGALGTPSTIDKNYFIASSFNAPISGETDGTNIPRTDGPNAVYELDYYNWSLINKDYYASIISGWSASGHLDTINKNIGYRLQLNSSTFSKTGTNMNVLINLTNIGYANSFKSRSAYIIFKNNSTLTTYQYQLTTDVNTWYSNVILSQTFSISSLASGTYSSYIWLPDNDITLSTRPEYSIQFSNTGVWDSLTGYNNLNQSFTK